MRLHELRADDGVATPVELMYVLVCCLVALAFLGFVGRLHAAGVEVANAAQSAARAASMEGTSRRAAKAAEDAVRKSVLSHRCGGGLATHLTWVPSSSGTWHGGSVTVEVTCTVTNESLAGVWAPGSRTIVMSDVQPVDRYQP